MHVIAGASPDNTPAGYYWTFLFPEILFIVSALILWALFGRPHHRVPAQRILLGLGSRASGLATPAAVSTAAAVTTAESAGAPDTSSAAGAIAEPEAPADAAETDGGEAPADGAGAGE